MNQRAAATLPGTLRDELLKYSEDIRKKRRVACKKHRWACLRFERDIKRENTKGFPYLFDEAKAQSFLNWMGEFSHHIGPLKGQRITPDIIQKFIFGNIYGWYSTKTGYRRFNKMYWQVARKNGKSLSLSCIGLYELMPFTRDETSEVYVAATKRDQARVVHDEAVTLIRQRPDLFEGKCTIAYGRITYGKNSSIMRPLSEEDRKTGDGLNPQCGIIDEYHAHETSEIYDIVDSGMGARTQPLLAIITTAGFDLNRPCYRVEYDLCSKILDPHNPIEMENYFVMINELDKNDRGVLLDDIKDEKKWEKANPIICSTMEGKDYLRKKLKEALEAPEKMRNFLTKHMDLWIHQPESSYMVTEKWAACKGPVPDLTGKICYIGVDLSAKIDLTSVGIEFPIDDKYYVKSHSFMPEETLESRRNSDKAPYDFWVNQGFITLTKGAAVDYKTVLQWIIDEVKKNSWRVEEICIDPWGAGALSSDLIDEGFTVVEVIQGVKTLSEPTKHFREMVYMKRVGHDGDPLLAWAIGNAIAEEVDRNKNLILNKKKSKGRIDPIVSIINAHVRAMAAKESVYNERGMRSLS